VCKREMLILPFPYPPCNTSALRVPRELSAAETHKS
jgi:hypothetical protein